MWNTGTFATGYAGDGVAIDNSNGLRIAIAANWNGGNAVYIWAKVAGTWTQEQKLTGTGNFGKTLAFNWDSSILFVGAQDYATNIGAVYVFKRSGSTWTQFQIISPTGYTGSVPHMGVSTACSGDGLTLASGAYGDNSNRGAVFIFTTPGGATSYTQTVKIAGPGTASKFGDVKIGMSNDGLTIAVGAATEETNYGAVYVYTTYDRIVWTMQARLEGLSAQNFGYSVDLSYDGTLMWVGCPGDTSSAGASYVYELVSGVWTNRGGKKVGAGGQFGYTVAVSGDKSIGVVGALDETSQLGATYVHYRGAPTSAPVPVVGRRMLREPARMR